MLNRAVPNHKNSRPLVITLRLSLYPDRTMGERIKKWRLENRGNIRHDFEVINNLDQGIKEGKSQKGDSQCAK